MNDSQLPAEGAEALARRLYLDHGAALRGWALRRLGDETAADEVVHESVMNAWRHYDQFDSARGSERAWMFGILKNSAASRYRAETRRRLRAVPSGELANEGRDDAELARITEASVIAEAFKALSPDHQAVVAAAYWRGLSTKEMASEFSIPEGTVKSRLHYALRILRTQLEEREVLR